jgi:hypothetical protein
MIARPLARTLGVAVVACFALAHVSQAQPLPQPQPRAQPAPAQPRPRVQAAPAPAPQPQAQPQPEPQKAQQPESQPSQAEQQPSAEAVALATKILDIKGGTTAFDPAIEGVVTHHKNAFLQINPNAARAVDEVARAVRADSTARKQELHNEIALGYASQFSEQDLKDLLAFYQTPLGKKIIEQEPRAGEAAAQRVQLWVDKYADDVANKMRAELRKKGFNEF